MREYKGSHQSRVVIVPAEGGRNLSSCECTSTKVHHWRSMAQGHEAALHKHLWGKICKQTPNAVT